MTRLTFHLAVGCIVVASIAGVPSLYASTSRGQSESKVKTADGAAAKRPVKPTARVRVKPTESASKNAPFVVAANSNGRLRSQLSWTFGGKSQSGWQLYTSLIGRLIGSESDADSAAFASALAKWQKRAGLTPSGVLDDDSLSAMISHWQGARLKDRSYPPAESLITVASSAFYDPTRPDELRQVERGTYAAYKRMIKAAAADPSLKLALGTDGHLAPTVKYLKIISAFRSREYQEQLRRQFPNSGRAGLAVNSPHFTGRALDLFVGGEPVETKDSNRAVQVQTRVYQWLVRNAGRFGFRPYFYEPWHWEYVE